MRHSVLQPALASPESASSSRCLITSTHFPPPDSPGRTQKESFRKSLMFGGNFSLTINTQSDFQDYLFLLSLSKVICTVFFFSQLTYYYDNDFKH